MANPLDDIVNGASQKTPTANPLDAVVSSYANKQTQSSSTPISLNPLDTAVNDTKVSPRDDPNRPWYEKAWDWANTPLANFNSENSGGFWGGTKDVASGLTSPLSVGLAVGTLGGSALLEGLGLTAEELPVVVRGVKALVDGGLATQGAYQAIRESPRVLDALKEGDYDTASRLAVHVVAGGGFSVLGGKHFLKDTGALIDDTLVKGDFKVKPSEENLKLRQNGGVYQKDIETNNRAAEILNDTWKKQFKTLDATDREGTMYLMQAGLDKGKLIERHNFLADAADRPNEKVAPLRPESEQPKETPGKLYYHGSNSPAMSSIDAADSAKYGNVGLTGIGTYITDKPEVASTEGYGGDVNGRVLGTKLSPNAKILDADATLEPELLKTLTDHAKDLVKKVLPQYDVENTFNDYFTSPGKDGKPPENYRDFIDGFRRLSAGLFKYWKQTEQSNSSSVIRDFQERLVHDGYDGVKYDGGKLVGGMGEHEAVMVFPGREKPVLTPDIPRKVFPTALEENADKTPHLPNSTDTDADKLDRYRELSAQKNLKQKYSDKEIDNLLKAYKSAIQPKPEMVQLAKQSGDHFNNWLEKAKDKGVVRSAIENYITQLWKPEDLDSAATNKLAHETRSGGFNTNVSMARQRTFENAFEGQLLGRKLKTADPITLSANYQSKVGEAISARDFLERLMDNHTRASDNRPMVAVSGTGELVENPGGGPATMVNPKNIRNPLIKNKIIAALDRSGQLDKFIQEGKIIKYEGETTADPHFAWNVHDYRVVDHPAFHDWTFASHDSNSKPVFVKGEVRVHPDIHEYLNRFIGTEKSLLQQSKPIAAALKVGSELKHLTLSLSPFHIAQEGLRALMTGVSPLGVENWDPKDPILRTGIEESLTLGKDRKSLTDFQEGNFASGQSKIISKVPVVRDVQNYMQNFLFDRYIPGLKARAFKALYERYSDKLDTPEKLNKLVESRPDLKNYDVPRAAARLAAEDTNERFGGLNYKQFGRSAGTQDFLRLATLAPDWLESELRFMKRTLTGGPEGSIARQDYVRMAAALWGVSRVLNYMVSGKPHNEAPFGVAVTGKDGKEKTYSVRTLPTDMLHLAQDPLDFLRGRISPLGRIGTEVYSGRDYAGRKQTPFQTFVDITRNVLPIPLQTAVKGVEGSSPDITAPEQVLKAAGGTATVYRTEAEKKAVQLASDRSEQGPVDKDKLLRHQTILELEDRLRDGRIQPPDVFTLVENGQMSVKEGKTILKTAEETKGMDPEQARLYARSSRLPMKDFLTEIWPAATNEEKALLSPLLIKKKTAYFKSAQKDMTPAERTNDKTYQTLRKMFPTEAPF